MEMTKMIEFTEELYEYMIESEKFNYRKCAFADIPAESVEAISKVIDFINNAEFDSIDYKPRRAPNPYYFVKDYTNRALSVLIILKFRVRGQIIPIEVDSKYGGLEGLVDAVIKKVAARSFDRPYMSPEYVFRAFVTNQSHKQNYPGMEVMGWPNYMKMVNTYDEIVKIAAILDKFAEKNTRISKQHQKALLEHDTYMGFSNFLVDYKEWMLMLSKFRARGYNKKELEKLQKIALKFSHEIDFMTPEQFQDLINLREMQTVHKK